MADPREMSRAEYKALQDRLLLLVEIVRGLDVDGLLEVAEHAQAVAPFFDPTAFQQKGPALQVVIDHARAAKTFKDAVAQIPRPDVPANGASA